MKFKGAEQRILISRLQAYKVFSKPTSLGWRNLKYIQDLITKHPIDITNKSRKQLIAEIYKKTKDVDIKKPTEDIVNIEVNKSKQEYFREYILLDFSNATSVVFCSGDIQPS